MQSYAYWTSCSCSIKHQFMDWDSCRIIMTVSSPHQSHMACGFKHTCSQMSFLLKASLSFCFSLYCQVWDKFLVASRQAEEVRVDESPPVNIREVRLSHVVHWVAQTWSSCLSLSHWLKSLFFPQDWLQQQGCPDLNIWGPICWRSPTAASMKLTLLQNLHRTMTCSLFTQDTFIMFESTFFLSTVTIYIIIYLISPLSFLKST